MTIHHALPLIRPLTGKAEVPGAKKKSKQATPSLVSSPTDGAELSSAASLASQAASLPDVRAEKVEAVKAALADGSYNVSSADVAQSMMDHMLGKK